MQRQIIAYEQARPDIMGGDLLLFRPKRGLFGRLICVAGRTEYSHAAMAGWWNGRLMCLETLQRHGGRAVLLSSQVARHPGQWDVYTIRQRRSWAMRPAAVDAMIAQTGIEYGWRGVFRVALYHLPFVRFFVRPKTDDDKNGSDPVCSHLVSGAYRKSGFDAVPNLEDAVTEPGDLARSLAFRYQFTLA